MKWKHFPRYLPFVRGILRSPVNSPHKGQWRGALIFSLICVWINSWVNNREAGDLRRYRAHYDVIVICMSGSLTRGGGESVPGIPGAWAIRDFYVSGKRPMETHSPPGKGRQEEPRGKRSGTKLSIHGTPFIAWNMFTMAHVLSNILRSSQALSFIWHYNFCCCSNSLCICTPKNQDFVAPDDHLLKSWFNFNSNMDK